MEADIEDVDRYAIEIECNLAKVRNVYNSKHIS